MTCWFYARVLDWEWAGSRVPGVPFLAWLVVQVVGMLSASVVVLGYVCLFILYAV